MSTEYTFDAFQSKKLPVSCVKGAGVVVVEDVGEFNVV